MNKPKFRLEEIEGGEEIARVIDIAITSRDSNLDYERTFAIKPEGCRCDCVHDPCEPNDRNYPSRICGCAFNPPPIEEQCKSEGCKGVDCGANPKIDPDNKYADPECAFCPCVNNYPKASCICEEVCHYNYGVPCPCISDSNEEGDRKEK